MLAAAKYKGEEASKVTVSKLAHDVPASVLNCHSPCASVEASAVIKTPNKVSALEPFVLDVWSSVASEKPLINVVTVAPPGSES